eukprot:1748931-Alexandrium_andersonii.AAC.1
MATERFRLGGTRPSRCWVASALRARGFWSWQTPMPPWAQCAILVLGHAFRRQSFRAPELAAFSAFVE